MAANKIVRSVVLGAAAVGAVAWGLHWWNTGRWLESTDNAYVRADIAVITPRIAGEVIEVAVRENQRVKKGDVLVRIDPRDYQARLANAQANVAQAEAALVANTRQQEMQAAMIDEARATLSAAEADRVRVRKDYERADSLVKDGVATQARLDIASAGYQSAQAGVSRGAAGLKVARTQVGALEAERASLEAKLQAAQAAEQLAALDLEATVLRAPSDGLIGNLAAKLGERVNAGLRLLSLVSAGPVWVEANFKETQLTQVVVGQPARVHVDAFPGAEISGRVESVSPASGAEFALLPADNATGNFTKIVQRVPVKLTLELTPELAQQLRSGMSVEAEIDTKPQG
ncbi:MAG: HlyD family secretion protein [Stagnimonas sp.]|nr:HlyD family secretion protein [Stagnimonas sp.]